MIIETIRVSMDWWQVAVLFTLGAIFGVWLANRR